MSPKAKKCRSTLVLLVVAVLGQPSEGADIGAQYQITGGTFALGDGTSGTLSTGTWKVRYFGAERRLVDHNTGPAPNPLVGDHSRIFSCPSGCTPRLTTISLAGHVTAVGSQSSLFVSQPFVLRLLSGVTASFGTLFHQSRRQAYRSSWHHITRHNATAQNASVASGPTLAGTPLTGFAHNAVSTATSRGFLNSIIGSSFTGGASLGVALAGGGAVNVTGMEINVPEPTRTPLFATALLGLLGFGALTRRGAPLRKIASSLRCRITSSRT